MELSKIGVIAGFHGLKGEAKVKALTDFKENRFKIGNELYLIKNNEKIKVTIKTWRNHKGMDLLSFNEYSDLTSIEHLKTYELYASKDNVEILEEDEYYYADLIGLDVYDFENNLIGRIAKINETSANDIIQLENGVLIPFVKAIVDKVDLNEKKVTLFEIEGLF